MTKAEQVRLVTWRSKILQHAAGENRTVAQTCRHFGISRKTYYKWANRQRTHGDAGLCDRARVAATIPARHAARGREQDSVSAPAVSLRRRQDRRLSRRFHQVSVARSTVHRLLVKHGVGRLPANQKHRARGRRWQRYEKPQPGHRLQVDVKFLERIPGSRKRLYQFTAIDDCTRVRVLKIFDACNQATAIRFIDDVFKRLPFRVRWCRPTTAPNSNPAFIGTWKRGTSARLYPPANTPPERQGRAVTSRR